MSGSFLTDKGQIVLPKEQVTWFSFFSLARALNSPSGGWNYKSLWLERGLEPLAKNEGDFVAAWTENSFEPAAEPLPRKRNFRFEFDRKDSIERRKLAEDPSTLALAREDVISYRLWLLRERAATILNRSEKLRLHGYEVPLCSERSGQLEVDLFGLSREGPMDCAEIIELKRTDSKDSPLLALVEGICYAIQTMRCADSLATALEGAYEPEAHPPAGDFARVTLTLAAPAGYWEKWSASTDEDRIKSEMLKIIEHLNNSPALKKSDRCIFLKFATISEEHLGSRPIE